MRSRSRRWWLARALGRSRLVRRIDRVEAWAVVAGLVVVLVAALYCSTVSDDIYAARSRAIAAEASTRHQAEAVATAASTPDKKAAQQATQRHTVHIQWLFQNATHDEVVKLDHAVKAGDHVPVWLDDRGNATTPPLTDADARADAVGGAILLWILVASTILGGVALLRRVLNRFRYRSWDRGLRWLLVDGGGPGAHHR
ncbi:membrane protein [Mycolicibacterium madagascariense]|uniref:Membrane protein n=1 Tax=Mycolicibacterium madagascariense TaxID=212765 RepID=A0A7I7XDD5_9MYCO|nr:hypothetical protein [Mycolicibacterium madagascariense]MCV7015179.1 hypothetical protein [Mycolicibacterium madagascariense]BBZ27472.1 membrane protein [Mycolicibacterium madagascariense]